MYSTTEAPPERLLDVAREILAQEGVDAVTVRRVAKGLSWTPMALYHYFPNRAALLDSVIEREFLRLAEVWSSQNGVSLEEWLKSFVDYALGQPHLYRALFVLPRASARKYPRDFEAGESPTSNLLVQALEAGIASGRLKSDRPSELALEIWALVQGYLELYLSGRIDMEEPELKALIRRALRRLEVGIAN